MGRVVANRRLPSMIIATLLFVGCASEKSATPTQTGAPASTSTVTPTSAEAPSPTVPPTSPVPATSTVTPTLAATALPTPASWREDPAQPSVSAVGEFRDVTWTGTRFLALGSANDGAGVVLDSTDGVAWHRQAGSRKGVVPGLLAAGPGGVVAVGAIGGRRASWSSVDGLTWVAHPDAFPPAPDGSAVGEDTVEVTDVVASGDGWLAVGRRDPSCAIDCGLNPSRAYVWTSSDGSQWTRVPDQAAFKGGGMVAVARGDDGFVAAGVASDHAAIWTSPDGLAWSRVPDAQMFHGPKSQDFLPVGATDVAVRDGVIVVVGAVFGQDSSGVRAWWSADGRTWSKASVAKAADGQMFSVAATPDGFLAIGWAGGCLGGIWASTDGHAWRCDASDPRFKGFGPVAAAASDTVEVAVGSTSRGDAASSSSAVWSRRLR